ncbi:hypothetical protein B0H63DRAFT_103589 [Podospora didyma]|uniref:Uncharacterized protein n=1 Tax=Podospora didyma TaxID=330526 RepID=A0AAE0U3R1_9PEZI|nr:hypothetical protein B0H63DRAFT_103589 [Podospora didyma]
MNRFTELRSAVKRKKPKHFTDAELDEQYGQLPISTILQLPIRDLARLSNNTLCRLPAEKLTYLPSWRFSQLPPSKLSEFSVEALERLPATHFVQLPVEILVKLLPFNMPNKYLNILPPSILSQLGAIDHTLLRFLRQARIYALDASAFAGLSPEQCYMYLPDTLLIGAPSDFLNKLPQDIRKTVSALRKSLPVPPPGSVKSSLPTSLPVADNNRQQNTRRRSFGQAKGARHRHRGRDWDTAQAKRPPLARERRQAASPNDDE